MCSLYSNMLAAVIPQLQQVSINVQSFLDPIVSDTFYDFSTFSNSDCKFRLQIFGNY